MDFAISRRAEVVLAILAMIFTLAMLAHAKAKTFPATHDSVAAENRRADSLGLKRYRTEDDMVIDVASGVLVPVPITVSKKLDPARRFVLAATADFMFTLDGEFNLATGKYLTVDSAIRPVDVQQRLGRTNKSAAPANGARASSHERGTTFDIARRGMTQREWKFLKTRLLYYRAIGAILVIEEKACVHIFVGGQS
jgi:Family of unknown function (DUF5715)